MTSLFFDIEIIVLERNEKYRDWVIHKIEAMIRELQLKWRDVSGAYGELRVYCLS